MPRFVDIPVGSKFKRDGGENDTNTYIKIPDERINCCKVNNAALASDMNQDYYKYNDNGRIIIPDNDEIELSAKDGIIDFSESNPFGNP